MGYANVIKVETSARIENRSFECDSIDSALNSEHLIFYRLASITWNILCYYSSIPYDMLLHLCPAQKRACRAWLCHRNKNTYSLLFSIFCPPKSTSSPVEVTDSFSFSENFPTIEPRNLQIPFGNWAKSSKITEPGGKNDFLSPADKRETNILDEWVVAEWLWSAGWHLITRWEKKQRSWSLKWPAAGHNRILPEERVLLDLRLRWHCDRRMKVKQRVLGRIQSF